MPDFKNPAVNSSRQLYDIDFDKVLIEQSIAKQYHILPSQQGDMPYSDWAKMVSGLMDDTPLGRVVQIRAEKDRRIVAKFGPEQKRIQSEWNAFLAQKAKKKPIDQEEAKKQLNELEKMLVGLFGGR